MIATTLFIVPRSIPSIWPMFRASDRSFLAPASDSAPREAPSRGRATSRFAVGHPPPGRRDFASWLHRRMGARRRGQPQPPGLPRQRHEVWPRGQIAASGAVRNDRVEGTIRSRIAKAGPSARIGAQAAAWTLGGGRMGEPAGRQQRRQTAEQAVNRALRSLVRCFGALLLCGIVILGSRDLARRSWVPPTITCPHRPTSRLTRIRGRRRNRRPGSPP